MKAKDLRKLSDEGLQNKLADLKEELFNLRFQLATGQLENTVKVKDVRKDIARVKTLMHERVLHIKRA